MERIALVLGCEGLGDALFAIPVIRKLRQVYAQQYRFDLFTHHPDLFRACPYVERALPYHAPPEGLGSTKAVKVFEADKLQHSLYDTFDFISIPLGIGTLSFREKQLEYFPVEEDKAERFDVVLNTSITWPTRSWPIDRWQRLAEAIRARGLAVAVVGKDVSSRGDGMDKRSLPLEGCANLVNRLTLDQTYFTIRKAGLFVTCQNGLSVLAGATDTEIVVLDMSIEWSKRAIYRRDDPHHKVTYVKGACQVYCCAPAQCPLPENRGELKCVPSYEEVERAVLARLPSRSGR